MRHLQVLITCVIALVFAALPKVSAVGRGLRAQTQPGTDPNSQGPSLAQLEDEEEDDELQLPQQAEANVLLQAAPRAESVAQPRLPEGSLPPQATQYISSRGSDDLHVATVDEVSSAVTQQTSLRTRDKAELGLSGLSASASVVPSSAQLEKLMEKPFPVTVPGIPSALSSGDAASAKALFPPQQMATVAGSSSPASNVSLMLDHPLGHKVYKKCQPPCIASRGVCNDNVCFCRSPYTGTTCQHKAGTLARVSIPLVVGFAGVSLLMGILAAQGVHAWISGMYAQRLSALGDGYVKKEVWCPPSNKKSVARGHPA